MITGHNHPEILTVVQHRIYSTSIRKKFLDKLKTFDALFTPF